MNLWLYIPAAVIILLSSVFILNALYVRTNYYRNTVQQLKKYTDGVPDNLGIVNTGSSYALYDLSYEKSAIKGFNFGLQPQTLSYDYKILRQYRNHLNENCVVLIVLPDLVFGFVDSEEDVSNVKYYYFLDREKINNFSKLKHITRVKLPVLSAQKRILHLIRDVKADDSITLSANPYSKEQVEKQADVRISGWKKQFGLKNMLDCDFSEQLKTDFEKNVRIVNEMIAFCLENNFKPVLIVPPVSEVLNNKYSKSFMNGFLYENIKKANTQKIPLLDYLYDERFQDHNLYINSDLMNKRGRDIFTQSVMEDLRKLLYL